MKVAMGSESRAAAVDHQTAAPSSSPQRAYVRALFLRLLGLIFLVAFLSLLVQVEVLYGNHGLLPAQDYLASLGDVSFFRAPTIFWLSSSDLALRAVAIAGAVLSFGLILNLAPLYCLVLLWFLYLSFATIGQAFMWFQWDNLLLETAFFAIFVTPPGLRPKPSPPHRIAVFLMLWLLLRLHVESGAAKLLTGDPTWRDLTAMVKYYETAPLPTWIGWYAHQMPFWAHRAIAGWTLFVELLAAWFIWSRHWLRGIVFAILASMQIAILLTANYAFFNYLTLALCLFVLDDNHLRRAARWLGRSLPAVPHRGRAPARTALLGGAATVLVPLSLLPFLSMVPAAAPVESATIPIREFLNIYRSVNAYHLFAQMTLERREVVIEGSADGQTWKPYEFRYKPGDPQRAPRFVAPHQPRVDFQLWFLLLDGRPQEPYFRNLLKQLLSHPAAVAPLFAEDPFPTDAPAFLRFSAYRYTFTDFAERRASGAWWKRELLRVSKPIMAGMLP